MDTAITYSFTAESTGATEMRQISVWPVSSKSQLKKNIKKALAHVFATRQN